MKYIAGCDWADDFTESEGTICVMELDTKKFVRSFSTKDKWKYDLYIMWLKFKGVRVIQETK